MGTEYMNIFQLISGGEPFPFPTTYIQLQLAFMILPMLILIFVPKRILHSSPHLHKYAWIFGAIMFFASLAQGATWDNFGASKGIWIFDSENMIGHIEFIPVEEYFCIINAMLITTIFTMRVWTWKTDNPSRFKVSSVPGNWLRYIIIALFLGLGVIGWRFLLSGEDKYLFWGVNLGFFAPFYALEWAVGYQSFMRHRMPWLISWIVPGIYMYLFDSLAVNQGIWIFDYKFTTNTWLFGCINIEVLVVYVFIAKAVSLPIFWVMDYYDRKAKAAPA